MKKKCAIESYEAPWMEVIEVKVEKGFATSGNEDYGDKDW